MKKVNIILCMVLFSCINLMAKGYIVCSSTGSVSCANGQPIKPSNYIDGTQEIVIGEYSQLSLLDEGEKLIYHLTTESAGTIDKLISERQSITHLTDRYLRAIKDKMITKSSVPSGRIAGGYRGADEDMMFIQSLCKTLNISSLSDLGKVLTNTNNLPLGDYLVKFDLISYRDGNILSGKADKQDAYHIRVKNYSNEALYIAIASIENEGKIYLLHDGNAGNYLLPGKTEIDYRTPIINFSNINNVGSIIVFASPFPVDFKTIFENIDAISTQELKDTGEMKIGIAGALIKL